MSGFNTLTCSWVSKNIPLATILPFWKKFLVPSPAAPVSLVVKHLAAHMVSAVAVQAEASKHVLKTASFMLVLSCIHVIQAFQPVMVDRCLRPAHSQNHT